METRLITTVAALVAAARTCSPTAGVPTTGGAFDRADLRDLRIEGVVLAGASFRDSDLRRTVFVDCDLSDADLSAARGLLSASFPGCDLRRARLPEDVGFDAPLATIQGAVGHARAVFLLIVAASLYCLLTVGATTDRDLLVNTASTPLPIVQTPVAIAAFYAIAPTLLLASVVWLHAYMQRVWTTLADLPSRFPDGLTLADRIDQWIPLAVGAGGRARRAATFGGLEATLSAVALWLITPGVMVALWARHLPRHDGVVSVWQIAVLALCLAFSAVVAVRARRTIARAPFGRRQQLSETGYGLAAASLTVAVLLPTTLAVIAASPAGPFDAPAARLVAWMDAAGLPQRLELSGADIAARPAAWSPALGGERLTAALSGVGTVDLAGRNLERAVADSGFFARVRLDGARLRAINAPLAVFVQASLVGADVSDAKLMFADLRDADLAGATLTGADLSRANLRGACFSGTVLVGSRLAGADLRGAHLAGAFGLSAPQIATAVCDGGTQLPIGVSREACGAVESDQSVGNDIDESSYREDTSFVPSSCF